ncbi:hypothetical protein MMC28_007322 [Mycoblastus sanguinarius]|nr:hypothetical protein [Mycoblastus sanguinarius]
MSHNAWGNHPLRPQTLVEALLLQILNMTRQPLLSELKGDLSCHICHERFLTGEAPEVPVKLPCGHICGIGCILKWLSPLSPTGNNSCPECRKPIFVSWNREDFGQASGPARGPDVANQNLRNTSVPARGPGAGAHAQRTATASTRAANTADQNLRAAIAPTTSRGSANQNQRGPPSPIAMSSLLLRSDHLLQTLENNFLAAENSRAVAREDNDADMGLTTLFGDAEALNAEQNSERERQQIYDLVRRARMSRLVRGQRESDVDLMNRSRTVRQRQLRESIALIVRSLATNPLATNQTPSPNLAAFAQPIADLLELFEAAGLKLRPPTAGTSNVEQRQQRVAANPGRSMGARATTTSHEQQGQQSGALQPRAENSDQSQSQLPVPVSNERRRHLWLQFCECVVRTVEDSNDLLASVQAPVARLIVDMRNIKKLMKARAQNSDSARRVLRTFPRLNTELTLGLNGTLRPWSNINIDSMLEIERIMGPRVDCSIVHAASWALRLHQRMAQAQPVGNLPAPITPARRAQGTRVGTPSQSGQGANAEPAPSMPRLSDTLGWVSLG